MLPDDSMEFYYGIIFMTRIPRMPRTSPAGAPGILGIPWARPWDPQDAPATPGHAPGNPGDAPGMPAHAPGNLGTSLGLPRTSLGPPGDAPGTPLGPPKTSCDLLWTTKTAISTNIQCQKLSLAVFEAARWGPSHEALDWAGLSVKSPRHQKNGNGENPAMEKKGVALMPLWPAHAYILNIYIYMCEPSTTP